MEQEKYLVAANDTCRPAKLPEHSRAAAAQRLNDLPQKPARGVYYAVPHRLTHPTGWRTRRYLKRKHLRLSNEQYATTDRIGTQFTMLPMALGGLAFIVVLASIFVGVTAIVQATQERFQQKMTTLADIIPRDSLKMYDMHH